MSEKVLTLGAEFPEARRAIWEELAAKALNGAPLEKLSHRTPDGIEIQPLYMSEDWLSQGDPSGFPGGAPYARGSRPEGSLTGWGIEPEVGHPDPDAANSILLEELRKGATGVVLRLDRASRSGYAEERCGIAEEGVGIVSLDDLDRILDGVLLDLAPVRMRAGASFMGAAALMIALWHRRGFDPAKARGSFGADPVGTLAEFGAPGVEFEAMIEGAAELAGYAHVTCPEMSTFAVDTSVFHSAGSTEAQELGCALAVGTLYLERLMQAGIDVDEASRQIEFVLVADENFFGSLAKLRAFRMTWARVLEAVGASSHARATRIRAETAERMMTRRDAWVNMLRTTSACFAAGVAGADAITVRPYNSALGLPDAFGRRIARNTQLILQEESSLNRVIDPAGGGWYLESLTDALAESGWREFQAIETEGGIVEALQSGKLQKRIGSAAAARERDIAKRRVPITGVSEFPNLREMPVDVESPDPAVVQEAASARLEAAVQKEIEGLGDRLSGFQVSAWVDAATSGVPLIRMAEAIKGSSEGVRPLSRVRLAGSFEALRDLSDRELERSGKRPQIFLANMGRIAHHTARATYASNFFEAGGVEAISNSGFDSAEPAAEAFNESGARLAVICGSDAQYEDSAVAYAQALKATGVERLYLAGRPGDLEAALREAGVDEFIHIGCDVLESLRGALSQLGVSDS